MENLSALFIDQIVKCVSAFLFYESHKTDYNISDNHIMIIQIDKCTILTWSKHDYAYTAHQKNKYISFRNES